MHIKYEARLEDYVEYFRFQFDSSKTIRRIVLRQRLLMACLLIFALVCWYLSPAIWLFPILAALLVALIALERRIALHKYTRNGIKILKEGETGAYIGPREIRLDEEYLHLSGLRSKYSLQYGAIEKVVRTEGQCLVGVGIASAMIIPRATVTEGDYDTFVAELTSRFEKSRTQTQKPT